jgi:cytochrome c
MNGRAYAFLAVIAACAPAWAEDGADPETIAQGKVLAQQNCAVCHSITAQGASPLKDAPAFRDIAVRYEEDELEEAFNQRVATEHPAMPDWQMTPEQAEQLSRYIMSLAAYGVRRTKLRQ